MVTLLVLLLAWGGFEVYGRIQARNILTADPATLPNAIVQWSPWQMWATHFLRNVAGQEAHNAEQRRERLHARLAVVSRYPSLVESLVEELLSGKVTYVLPIRGQLRPMAAQLTDRLRTILRDEKTDPQRRFRAALALADYVPDSEADSWTDQDLRFVAKQLVSSNAEFQSLLREALRPIHDRLLKHLEQIFADATATDAQRLGAANALTDYAVDDTARLSRLLAVATPEQHAVIYKFVADNPALSTLDELAKIVATGPPTDLGSVDRVSFGQRRANAAATLLRLGGRAKVPQVFEVTDDPEALTQFIFRCRPRKVSVDALLDCLQLVSDAPHHCYPCDARYALLLALGEYTLDEVPNSRRELLLKQLADWYRNDPSSGVHGAAGWLLRHWEQTEIARQVDQTMVPYSPDQEWFTLAITVTLTPQPGSKEKPAGENTGSESEHEKPPETDNSSTEEATTNVPASDLSRPPQGSTPQAATEPIEKKTFYYTFIVFPRREYTIGSVEDEPERSNAETRHAVMLTRGFALLDREITFEELIAFSPGHVGSNAAF